MNPLFIVSALISQNAISWVLSIHVLDRSFKVLFRRRRIEFFQFHPETGKKE
jgi:hypothetical protein